MSSLLSKSYFDNLFVAGGPPVPPPVAKDPSAPFLSSLTLSAYLKVFRECSQQLLAGETLAIIVVFEFPVKESLRT